MSRIPRAVLAVALAGLLAAGCSGGSDRKPTGQADIADTGPYWCGVVPRTGLQAVTGQAGGQERSVPAPDATPAVPIRCSVDDGLLLFERASGATAAKYLKQKPPVGSEPHTKRIPSALGKGAAAGSDKQWHVYAYFRCGSTKNLFTLSVSDVAHGRDADADLIRLMGIAQHRYAAQAHCTLTGAGSAA